MKLNWSPIQIATEPWKNVRKCDWDGYETELNQFNPPSVDEGDCVEVIDEKLKIILEKLKITGNKYIPTVNYRTLPHPLYSSEEKDKISRINYLRELNDAYLCTWDEWNELKSLQRELNSIAKAKSNENWDTIIRKININTDPYSF